LPEVFLPPLEQKPDTPKKSAKRNKIGTSSLF